MNYYVCYDNIGLEVIVIKGTGDMKRPSYVKALIAAAIMAIFISGAVISVQLSQAKNLFEQNFKTMHGELSAKVFNRGYGYYISEDNDKEQMQLFLSNIAEGVSFQKIYFPYFHTLVMTDVYKFYDSEFNCVNVDDTLLYIESDEEKPDSKKRHFYAFKDENLANEIDKLVKEYDDNIGTVVFNVKDVYVKDDNTFIPGEVSCYAMGSGGSQNNLRTLYTAPKDKAGMEEDGYRYVRKNENFFLGESGLNGASFAYCYGLDDEREQRVSEILDWAIQNSGGSPDQMYERKDISPFSMELYSVRKNDSSDADRTYYILIYERINVLAQGYSYTALNGRGIMYGEIYALEMIGLATVFMIIAALIVKIKRKKMSRTA